MSSLGFDPEERFSKLSDTEFDKEMAKLNKEREVFGILTVLGLTRGLKVK